MITFNDWVSWNEAAQIPTMDDGTDWATHDNPSIRGVNNKVGDKMFRTDYPGLWIMQSARGFTPTTGARNFLAKQNGMIQYFQDYEEALRVGRYAMRSYNKPT